MNMHAFFRRPLHFPISRRAAITLAAMISLAWSSFAFCGEIHDASQTGDLAKVRALLKSNPSLVSSKDENGDTPLHWAACFDHKDVAELLLASGADVNAKDGRGLTPFEGVACGFVTIQTYSISLDGNARGTATAEPSAPGSYPKSLEVAQLLITKGANVNAGDIQSAPLFGAIEGRNLPFATLLLANHADVNGKMYDGETPLHRAVVHGQKAVAELLLANHADVNAKDNDGETPLHYAARLARRNVAELLLANHADVNAKDNNGETPLHYAARIGDEGLVELLLQHQPPMPARSQVLVAVSLFVVSIILTGVLFFAYLNSLSGILGGHWIQMHLPLFGKVSQKLLLALLCAALLCDVVLAVHGYKALVASLLAAKTGVNAKNKAGETPLHVAAVNNYNELVELLRQHGGHE